MSVRGKVPLAPQPFLPAATSGRNCMYILKASEASTLGVLLLASDCIASMISSKTGHPSIARVSNENPYTISVSASCVATSPFFEVPDLNDYLRTKDVKFLTVAHLTVRETRTRCRCGARGRVESEYSSKLGFCNRAYGPHFARIDGYGRPDAAAIDLKATQTNAPVLPVLSNCNLLVRNLADNLTTYRRDRNDFPASLAGLKGWNAGHLVARSMGGWNQRANLVPMLGAINKSFASLEKAALQCRSDPLIVSALYEVHALYPGDYASKYDNWGVDHAFNEVREIGVPYGLSVTLTGSKQIGAQNVPFSPSIEFNLLPEFWFHNTDAIIDHFHPLERQKLDAMRTVIRSICSDGNSPTVVDVQDIPDVEYGELGNIVDGYFRSFAEYFSQIFGGEESQ